MITVVARSTFRPETLGTALDLYRRLVDHTRTEAGCRRYELHRDRSDPHSLTMIEEWDDEAALKAHSSTAFFLETVGQLRPLAAGPGSLATYDLVY